MKQRRAKAVILSPTCRLKTLYRVDLRTLEGKTVKFVRQRLTDYVGGNPDPKQVLLIERAAWLTLRICLKEQKLMAQGPNALSRHDDLHYLSWVNSLTKILDKLSPAEPGD